MPKKMSRWGIGPIFAFLSIAYGLMTLIVSRHFDPFFTIGFVPQRFLSMLGIILIGVGLPFFIIAVKTVMRAYNADALVTGGIYRCCRHPLYAAWVVFIVPGIVLWANTWLGLTAPLFMYLLLRILVRKEETYLENVFGSDYVEYKKRVPCILPVASFSKTLF
jgi:protein-S-isoprenylcysteine O-methyltransferase Ste14